MIKELIFYLSIICLVFCWGLYIGSFNDEFKESKILQTNKANYLEHGKFYKDLHNLTLQDFNLQVINNYEYTTLKDCKFYSMVWHDYFITNEWQVDFITTDKHILVIAWKNNTICTADLEFLSCRDYIF